MSFHLNPRRLQAGALREALLRFVVAVAPALISGALWLLRLTLRVRFENADDLFARWERGEQLLVAFWHNRVVMMPCANRSRKLCVMNSRSRDGEIATRAMARWGIHSVRGSASRGAIGGFLQLIRAYRDGYSLALVPDGPRGPRYQAKAGMIHLARTTGAPLFPVTYSASRKLELRSWDRLIIPLPFATIRFIVGEPLRVPRHATDEDVERLRQELENRLNAITARADAEAGAP